jgi:cytochrome b561
MSSTSLSQQPILVAPSHLQALPWAKYLHWITACMFIMMFISGVIMTQLGGGTIGDTIFAAHKLFGAITLLLFAARLVYRLTMQIMGRWNKNSGSRVIHYLLYGVGLSVPLLGWAAISDFGARGTLAGITLPNIWPEGAGYSDLLFSTHAWMAFLFVAIVITHISYALHDYVSRGADIEKS